MNTVLSVIIYFNFIRFDMIIIIVVYATLVMQST